MFNLGSIATSDKTRFLADFLETARSVLDGERDRVAGAANTAALLKALVPDLSWAGFYFADGAGGLVLGPFQGLPACVRIGAGRGVCGTALVERRSIRVPDVDAFPGHIACDTASRSELVTPILVDGEVKAVIDLDSATPDRFDAEDEAAMIALAALLATGIDWTT